METITKDRVKTRHRVFNLIKSHKKLSITLFMFVLLVLVIALFFAFKDNVPTFSSDSILRENIEYRVKVNGISAALNEQKVHVKTSGTVSAISVSAGDRVEAGQVLAILSSQELDRQLEKARIQVETEKTRLELSRQVLEEARNHLNVLSSKFQIAKSNHEANQHLFEQGALSKFALDASGLEFAEAEQLYMDEKNAVENGKYLQELRLQENQYQAAQVEYNGLAEEKQKQNVVSPISGTIGEVFIKLGTNVMAESEAFYIVDNANIEVKANVGEYEAQQVKLGCPMTITTLGGNEQTFNTTVSYISPYAKKSTSGQVTQTIVEVKGLLTNESQAIKSGLTLAIDILCDRKENVLTIPYEAILTTPDNKKYVLIISENQTTIPYEIATGLEGALRVELISTELAEGAKVLLNPTMEIYHSGNPAGVKL